MGRGGNWVKAAWIFPTLLFWPAVAVPVQDPERVDPGKVKALRDRLGDFYFGPLPTPEEYEVLRRAEREFPEVMLPRSGHLWKLRSPREGPSDEDRKRFLDRSRERFPYEDEKIYPYSIKVVNGLLRGWNEGGKREGPDESYLKWAFSTPRGKGYEPLDGMTAEDRYKGEEGGLYGGGRNEPPPAHHAAALARLRKIEPLDAAGRPAPEGRIVLLSIGMSNASEGFRCFKSFADRDPQKSPRVVVVDGAQPSQTLGPFIQDRRYEWGGRARTPWGTVEERLGEAGVTLAQVQVAWIKQVHCPNGGEPLDRTFERNARPVARDYVRLMNVLQERCPNIRIAFFSSRVYGGYAMNGLHPEPFAYETAFSIRWVIRDQIQGLPELNHDPGRGPVRSPLLLWGPYLWADGANPRKSDGLTWLSEDIKDGTHKSYAGCLKVKDLILAFFKTSPYAAPWFLRK